MSKYIVGFTDGKEKEIQAGNAFVATGGALFFTKQFNRPEAIFLILSAHQWTYLRNLETEKLEIIEAAEPKMCMAPGLGSVKEQ